MHGKLMEVDGRCYRCTKVDGSLQKVPQLHRNLMESLTDTRKVGGRSHECTKS